ncbi:DUF2913 family protein [Erwinia persicina]|uniref:DUF2913 family protein n=1 Tax=Erwinia persicina TaxID=55211 RepID=UPI0007898D20|nr:DUF2913 family protein [Erwinia persicina]HBI08030.1 DUF2913 domain-containing protein [Erwinia persicina]
MNFAVRDFSWALLVAVRLFHQNGQRSLLEEHIFIMRWLEQAKRKKIFPVSVAPEIDFFLKEGKRLHYRAGLRAKAEYIWNTCTGKKEALSDLRRVTSFFEAMQMVGWRDVLVPDSEWDSMTPKGLTYPAVYLRKSALHQGFDLNENMLYPMTIRLSAAFPGLMLLAEDARLSATGFVDDRGFYSVTLFSLSATEQSEQFEVGESLR